MDAKIKNIFIVNGAPGSGKTTFESMVKLESEKLFFIVATYSTIDFVKEIARECGWDGSKTSENRKFLSDLKDLLTKWNNIPFKKILNQVNNLAFRFQQYDANLDRCIVFIDCREPEEIKKLCVSLDAKSILIRRAEAEKLEVSNHADRDILNYNYDIIIDNNGNLEDLRKKVLTFIEKDLA